MISRVPTYNAVNSTIAIICAAVIALLIALFTHDSNVSNASSTHYATGSHTSQTVAQIPKL